MPTHTLVFDGPTGDVLVTSDPVVKAPPYLTVAAICGAIWGYGVAYEDNFGPCPNPDDFCEASMAAPLLIGGYLVVTALMAIAWAAFFLAVRRYVIEKSDRSRKLLPAMAAAWWIPPISIAATQGPRSWLLVPIVGAAIWTAAAWSERSFSD